MKQLIFIGFLSLITFKSYSAKLINSDTKTVSIDINSVTLELSAKCNRPQFEDDQFTVYFSSESYVMAKPYIESGFSMKLVDRTCGNNGTGPKLSEGSYENVTVYFVDGITPRKKLEQVIKEIW